MTNEFIVQYPDTFPDAVNVSRREFEQEAKLAMAIKLFEMGRLSSGMAAQIAGIGRVQFLLQLDRFGIPMIDLSEEEIQQDCENV